MFDRFRVLPVSIPRNWLLFLCLGIVNAICSIPLLLVHSPFDLQQKSIGQKSIASSASLSKKAHFLTRKAFSIASSHWNLRSVNTVTLPFDRRESITTKTIWTDSIGPKYRINFNSTHSMFTTIYLWREKGIQNKIYFSGLTDERERPPQHADVPLWGASTASGRTDRWLNLPMKQGESNYWIDLSSFLRVSDGSTSGQTPLVQMSMALQRPLLLIQHHWTMKECSVSAGGYYYD